MKLCKMLKPHPLAFALLPALFACSNPNTSIGPGAGGSSSSGGRSGSGGTGGAAAGGQGGGQTGGGTGASNTGGSGGANTGSGGSLTGSGGNAGSGGAIFDANPGSDTTDVASDGGGVDGAPTSDRLICNPGPEGNGVQMTTSVVPPEWTLRTGVTAGRVTASVSFPSTIYGGGYTFPYRIYTSANYVKGKPAIFLVFGDGGLYLGNEYKTPTVLDNLTAAGEIPPTVALFIEPGRDRVGTYDPPTDKYARFLTEEIIPTAVLPNYSISTDPNAWATVGYSASGEAGFAAVWHRPDKFHKFFGHSASFGASIRYGGWVWADKIMMAPMRELRVSLVVAASGDLSDDRGSWRTINENVAKALAAKGNPYRLIIGPGDHGGLASKQDFPNALRWMWRGCKFGP
jgi:enterochelin esterase-like enzyme